MPECRFKLHSHHLYRPLLPTKTTTTTKKMNNSRAARAFKRQSCLPNACLYFQSIGKTELLATSQDIELVCHPIFFEKDEDRATLLNTHIFQSCKENAVRDSNNNDNNSAETKYLIENSFLNVTSDNLTFWHLKDNPNAIIAVPLGITGRDSMSHVYVGIEKSTNKNGSSTRQTKKRKLNINNNNNNAVRSSSSSSSSSSWKMVAEKYNIKQISNVSSSLLKDLDAIIFDCDGVIWRGPNAIEKSKEFVDLLYEQGKEVFFVSNNATKTLMQYKKKFNSMSVKIKNDEQINNSALATARYMKNNVLKNVKNKTNRNKCYVVGTPGLVQTLKTHSGFEIIDGCTLHGNKGQKEMKTYDIDQLDKDVSVVVVSVGDISYLQIHVAALYIRYQNCMFLSTNRDACANYLPSGTVAPAAGAIVSAVEVASDTKPINMGKPSKEFVDIIIKSKNLRPERTMMVGDRLDTDILFGKNGGLKTLLVLSGVIAEDKLEENLKQIEEKNHPDFIASSLADFFL